MYRTSASDEPYLFANLPNTIIQMTLRAMLLLLPMSVLFGCQSATSDVGPLVAPAPMVLIDDDDELMDCDLCKRGQRGENLWCDNTNQGYVGGETVTSYACFECKSEGSQSCEGCTEEAAEPIACDTDDSNAKTAASDCGGDA